MSDNVTVKAWSAFTQITESISNGEVLIRNLDDGEIYRIKESIMSGGTDSGDKWDASIIYATGAIVVYDSKLWESLQDSNENQPPVEGSYWTEVSKSTANGFGRWAAGVITIDPTIVINGDSLYVLSESVTLPFNSTDFDAELLAGQWIAQSGSGGYAEITGEPSGFRYPDTTIVTYDSTNRTITLTGDVEAYYKGSQIPALVNGWVSDAHDIADGTYFLSHNGTDFVWSTSAWTFEVVMIALVYIDGASFCLRECHGLMQWQAHQEFHNTIGTYVSSGGDLSNYVLESTTAADRRPDISQTTLFDEDLKTINAALTTNLYSQLYLDSVDDTNILVDQAEILPLLTDRPYYNLFTGGVWTQALMSNNQYAKLFVMAVPVTADTDCQKRRYVFIQPQTQGTLANIQAVTTSDINLGTIATGLEEYVYVAEIIIQYSGGNWDFIEVNKLTGNRLSQVSSPSGNYLSSVSVGDEFSGDGSASSPLYFLGKIYNTARSFFSTISADLLTANRLHALPDKDIIFAGLDDIPDPELTTDELAAVNGANTPSASNVFATISDIHPDPSITLSDETTDIDTAVNDSKFPLTRAQTFTGFVGWLNEAATGTAASVNVIKNSVIIATITLPIGVNYATTTTISDVNGVAGDVMEFDCVSKGAIVAGKGLKCFILSNAV